MRCSNDRHYPSDARAPTRPAGRRHSDCRPRHACGGMRRQPIVGRSRRRFELPLGGRRSACMRSHGVLSFPDPDSGGHLPKADPHQLGVSPSQLQAAQRACQHVLPNTGASFQQQTQQCFLADACPPALVQRILTAQREVRPVHSVPRRAELARPHDRFPGTAVLRRQQGRRQLAVHTFVGVRIQGPRMRAPCQRLLRRRTRGDGVRGAGMRGVIATAALTVLAAACSSSPSSAGAGSPPGGPGSHSSTLGVAYSACMRSHGVPSFPTPTAAEASPRPTRTISGSAAPSCRRPSKPASTCSRTPAGRSTPTRSTVHDGQRLSPALVRRC